MSIMIDIPVRGGHLQYGDGTRASHASVYVFWKRTLRMSPYVSLATCEDTHIQLILDVLGIALG